MASKPETASTSVSFLAGISSVENTTFENCKVIGQHIDVHVKNKASPRPLPLMYEVPARNDTFVGRTDAVSSISKFITKGLDELDNSSTPTIYILLHGLGGVGKTSLAQNFVWNSIGTSGTYFEARIKSAIWLGAGTRDVLVNNYIELGERQNVLERESDKEVYSVVNAKSVLDWITAQNLTHLFVFDSLGNYGDIKDLVPVRNAVVIFTSRYTENFPNGCLNIHVNCFSTIEALNFMKQIIPEAKYVESDAETLVKTLGHLPLALAYACAYIKKSRGLTIQNYLRFYAVRKERLSLLTKKGLPDYAESVYITWDITMDELSEQAKDWIHLCACFYNEGIPGFLLQCFINKHKRISEVPEIPEFSLEELEFSLEFYDVQGDLESYSFARVHSENQSMTFHNLVQDVCRLKWDPAEAKRYLYFAVDLIFYVYPESGGKLETTFRKRTLIPHFESLVKLLQNTETEFYVSIPSDWVLTSTVLLAQAYESCSNPSGSKECAERLFQMERNNKLEMDGREKAIAFHLLGNANGSLGFQNKRYECLLEAVRHLTPPLFEPSQENPGIASLRIQLYLNLGAVNILKGDCGDAEKWFLRVLEQNSPAKDGGHEQLPCFTFCALTNLGAIHSRTGQYQKGLEEIKAGLEIHSQIGYDSTHPWSLQLQMMLFEAERRLGITPSVDLNLIHKKCIVEEDFENAGALRIRQGMDCQANKDLSNAIKYFEESVAHFQTANSKAKTVKSLSDTSDAICHLAYACIASGNLVKVDEATKFLEEELNSFRNTNPDSDGHIIGATILFHLAAAARMRGKLEKSWDHLRQSFRRSLDFYSLIWGEQRLIARILEGIAATLFQLGEMASMEKDNEFMSQLLDFAFVFENLAMQINENPKTAFTHLYESKEISVSQNQLNIKIYKEFGNARTKTIKLPEDGFKIQTMGRDGGSFIINLLDNLNTDFTEINFYCPL